MGNTTSPRSKATARSPELGTHTARVGGLVALIGVGAFAVLAMWWNDTVSIVGLGGWLTNAGRVTGLLAGYAVAVLLVLMSRAPALERGIGADQLARLHAHGGRYTVGLIAAHAALITWGYAVTAHTSVFHQTSTLLLSYPDVLMATVAGALFIVVGALSARAARARLRYETWYHLHLYTYLAIALAFSHQFSTGADFVDNLRARIVWSALYIGAATLVVWYRIVVPTRGLVRHRMRVVEVRPEAAGVVSIIMVGDHLDELSAESGQFFRWRFLTRDGWWQSHPFSLSAPPHRRYLRITVKRLGDHSAALQHVGVGTRVFAEGPYGAMTARRRRRRKALLIAGGVGITPLRALFESMPGEPGDLAMIVRANRESDVVFRHELDLIAERRCADLHFAVGPPGCDADPFRGQRLLALYPDLPRRDVFVCGPPAFMAVVTEQLRRCGLPGRYLHRESFAFRPKEIDMKRAVVTALATAIGLVLLLQFKVHTIKPTAGKIAALAPISPPTHRSVTAPAPQPTHRSVTSPAPQPTHRKVTAPATRMITGQTVHTHYGPVQVQIVETGHTLTNVTAIQLPDKDPRSQQIAAAAVPILRSEALTADSARIDVVSGATYTSNGYAQSLQSALDRA